MFKRVLGRAAKTALRASLLTGAAATSLSGALAAEYEIDDLSVFNTVNIEDLLNTLPQLTPGFDASSNNPGDGSATLDLRGLGPQRTLVLVNGKRIAGGGSENIFDANAVPASFLSSATIRTGEGAVRYGAGVIGGVIDLSLERSFEGISLSASHELSATEWDAGLFNASFKAGTKFSGGRGRIVLLGDYTDRRGLEQGERPFSASTLLDPGPGGLEFSPALSTFAPGGRILGRASTNFSQSPVQVGALDPQCGPNNENFCQGFRFDGAGALRGFRINGLSAPNDLFNSAPANYLQTPQERFAGSAFLGFEISDRLEIYAEGLFSANRVDTKLPATGSLTTYDLRLDNPAIPAALLSLIAGDPTSNNLDGTATIRVGRRFTEAGDRVFSSDRENLHVAGGVKGDLGGGLGVDVFAAYSRVDRDLTQSGGVSLSSVAAGVFCDAGPSAQADPACAGVPYVDILSGVGSISEDAAAFISRSLESSETYEQLQLSGVLSGPINFLQSPLASNSLTFATGAEYRDNDFESVGASSLNASDIGLVLSPLLAGDYDVWEIFGEVEAPLISERPLFELLQIRGGYRFSDYSLAGLRTVGSFHGGADWRPIAALRMFADFQRSHRVPSPSDLFGPMNAGFEFASDPCSGGPFGSFSPSTIVATCTSTGVPAGAAGDSFQISAQTGTILGGNSNLAEERAETLTFGFDLKPAAIKGLVVGAVYFDIDANEIATELPAQFILEACHLNGDANFCALISRDQGIGSLTAVQIGPVGGASFRRKGVDVTMRFEADNLPFDGKLAFTFDATRNLSNRVEIAPLAGLAFDCNGSFGFVCGAPSPKYKHALYAVYSVGAVAVDARWRRIGAVNADEATASLVSDLSDNIGAANYIDASIAFTVLENLELRLGVRNLTGNDPPVLGSPASEQANTWPSTYDTLGRQVFAGASLRF